MTSQSSKYLHIVSFDIPFPPNYGGVMDVFYKIKALAQLGVKIHLHAFEYGRNRAEELNKYCESIEYYSRDTRAIKHLSKLPYIVISRNSESLLTNLLKDDYPILFEGLHTSGFISDSRLKSRMKIVRTHNIEHEYYKSLSQSTSHPLKKNYFALEAKKLKNYEQSLAQADVLAAISQNDYHYLKSKFSHVQYIPAFHPNNKIGSLIGRGDYLLYHGNLSVEENITAAVYLVDEVFSKLTIPSIIAGKNPSKILIEKISKYTHIQLIANPSFDKMEQLISLAHINILPTFQATGIKLKLLQSLALGRHCIVNKSMVENTGLESLCSIQNHAADIIREIKDFMSQDFSLEMFAKREQIFSEHFSNIKNAQKLMNLISACP